MHRFVLLAVLLASARVCGAASITYVITDTADPAHPKEIASGTKTYSVKDVRAVERGVGKRPSSDMSLELADGYRIGASVYREKRITGFGLWADRDGHSFSWEWFDRPEGDVFKKLQEGGRVRVTFHQVEALRSLASITFLSDVSLRLDETFEVGAVTKRILIRKGSVLELPP